ncbi:MAG: YgjV family protein [Clostridia bacterium]|nr:YgjV family protein [Clostridia bacterium]
MDYIELIGQGIGIVAFCLAVWSFQQNEHKKIVLFQLLANLCFATNYFMIGAYTGALLNTIGLARSIVFIFKDKKWAASNWWLVFFSLVCAAVGIYTWEGPLTLLPMSAMILTTIAFGINNPKITRLLSFPSSPLWLVYNVVKLSWGGVLTECFNMGSIIIGMLRFDRSKK